MENSNSGFWNPDVIPGRKFHPVSPTQLRALGLSKDSMTFVQTLEELREGVPNIVIAKATKDLAFMQNWFKQQTMKKNVSYVMGLGVYQQLHRGTKPGDQKTKLLKPSGLKFSVLYNPYLGQDLNGKTLLVFRTGGIGDLLFIQPNLRYLKQKYPDCTINFACGPQYQAMVENWDCIDNVLDLPFPLSWLQSADYHALFEGVIERCKQAHHMNAYHLFTKWLNLNLDDHQLVPQQEPKADKVEECIQILENWGIIDEKIIVTQLRASSPIRTPRPSFWLQMINKLTEKGFRVLLTDNPRQTQVIDAFIKSVERKDMVFNFCEHSNTLDYTIALASLCSSVVATDSALNHIAASLNKPCYGIYGPFPGFVRLLTYPKARWVDGKKECAPCYIHGHTPCPKAGQDGFSPCYDNIDLNKVVDEIEEITNG